MDNIYMASYDNNSKPDQALCLNGLNFSTNQAFLLISNKSIPKHSKVYFEFQITNYIASSIRKNIPIYAGIHKEPSFGILNSDFCIGSLFYTLGSNYDIIQKYNKTAEDIHSSPSTIYTRIPGINDIIGVGVDTTNNLITFYNNGNKFYSFSPSLFTINNEEPFYFVIWGNIICNLKGVVNFGKTGVKYLPSGYASLYGEYYRQTNVIKDITGDIVVERFSTYGSVTKDITGNIQVTNSIKNDGLLYLVSTNGGIIEDKLEYSIPYTNTTNYLTNGKTIFCNLPIPCDRKVYFEFYVKEGTLLSNIIGIPISVGLSSSLSNISNKSIRMSLYHRQWANYTYTEVLNSVSTIHQISDVDTSVSPEQGKVIGVCINLKDNEISILVNKIPLYTFKAVNLDFSKQTNLSYFFIHEEGVFSNTVTGSFNFGLTDFMDDIPDGYISLYDYYNLLYLNYLCSYITGDITIIPAKTTKVVYIHGDIIVLENEDPNAINFPHPSLNRLMKTYNTISDVEADQTVDRTIEDMHNDIKTNNNGYDIK